MRLRGAEIVERDTPLRAADYAVGIGMAVLGGFGAAAGLGSILAGLAALAMAAGLL